MSNSQDRDRSGSPLKPFWGILVILLAVVAITAISRAFREKEMVPWRDSLADARKEARQSGKPVLAYFTAAWCGPCQQMKHTTWASPQVEAALQDYVPVKIDVDRDAEAARAFGINQVPTYLLITPAAAQADDEIVKAQSGKVSPEEFIEWLES